MNDEGVAINRQVRFYVILSEESCWQYVNFTISLLPLRFFGRCAPSSMTNYGSVTIFSSFIITLYPHR